MKKRIIQLSSLIIATMPAVSLMSCFGTTSTYTGQKFDSVNDGLLKIHTRYTSDSPESYAFNDIVEFYNSNVLDGKGYPIEVSHLDNNDKLFSDFNWDTERKNTLNLPNLYFGDTELVGTVAKKEMHLDISKHMNLQSIFPSSFIKYIREIINTKSGNVPHLPVASRARALFIDEPLFAHIIKVYQNKGGQISGVNNQRITELMERFFGANASVEDKTEINLLQSKWTSIPGNVNISEYPQLDDSIFNNFEPLIRFSTFAKKLFVKNDSQYIFGVDNIISLLYTILFSIAEGRYDYGLYHIDNNEMILDFLLKGKSAPLENIYLLLQDAIKQNALYISQNPEDPKLIQNFKTHKVGIVFGDTSLYHNYFLEEITGMYYLNGSDESEGSMLLYNKITANNHEVPGEHIAVFNRNGNVQGKIYPFFYSGKMDEFDIKLSSIEDTQFLMAMLHEFSPSRDKIFISEKSDSEFFDDFSGFAIIPVGQDRTQNKKGDGRYIVTANNLLTDSTSVQSNEISYSFGPAKFNEIERVNVRYIRSDSFIPIHINAIENKKIMDFIKWYLTGKMSIDEKEYIPGEYFAEVTNTILPTSNYLLNDEEAELNEGVSPKNRDQSNKLHYATKNVFRSIAEEEIVPFYSPMDDKTFNIKNYLRFGLYTLFNKSKWEKEINHDSGNNDMVDVFKTIDFNEFIATIKKKIQTW